MVDYENDLEYDSLYTGNDKESKYDDQPSCGIVTDAALKKREEVHYTTQDHVEVDGVAIAGYFAIVV